MAKSHRVGRDKQELSNAQKGRFVGAGRQNLQFRLHQQQNVTRSIAEGDAAWVAIKLMHVNRSHAAWTEFMPVRVAKAFANEWVKIHFHTQ